MQFNHAIQHHIYIVSDEYAWADMDQKVYITDCSVRRAIGVVEFCIYITIYICEVCAFKVSARKAKSHLILMTFELIAGRDVIWYIVDAHQM